MSCPLPRIPFYFLRHGVTDHNLRRLVMGRLDVPLNDLGRRQASAAAVLVRSLGIRSILSSPLSRALETAQIVAGGLDLGISVIDDLQERDWGPLAGRSNRELLRHHLTPTPGIEPADRFAARIMGAIAGRTEPAPVLLVAHSGTCRALRRVLAIDDGEGPVPNAVPLLFSPRPEGGWRERIVPAPQAADLPEAPPATPEG